MVAKLRDALDIDPGAARRRGATARAEAARLALGVPSPAQSIDLAWLIESPTWVAYRLAKLCGPFVVRGVALVHGPDDEPDGATSFAVEGRFECDASGRDLVTELARSFGYSEKIVVERGLIHGPREDSSARGRLDRFVCKEELSVGIFIGGESSIAAAVGLTSNLRVRIEVRFPDAVSIECSGQIDGANEDVETLRARVRSIVAGSNRLSPVLAEPIGEFANAFAWSKNEATFRLAACPMDSVWALVYALQVPVAR